MVEIGQLLADFWRLFDSVYVPVLGIKFSTFALGIFAIEFSILILSPILGIGRSIAHPSIKIRRSRKSGGDKNT